LFRLSTPLRCIPVLCLSFNFFSFMPLFRQSNWWDCGQLEAVLSSSNVWTAKWQALCSFRMRRAFLCNSRYIKSE
jgi:hypothetical protein